MNRCASLSPLGSEFDRFLFAPISENKDEMPLSVLSALARLDVDPWEEAATLAQLPRASAIERLISLIAALPHGASAPLDAERVSARLIALLPQQASSPSRESFVGAGAVSNPRAFIYVYVIFTVFVLAAQCIIASRRPPVLTDDARTPASSTVFPPMPTPSSGQ
jgi:hypothetical protein